MTLVNLHLEAKAATICTDTLLTSRKTSTSSGCQDRGGRADGYNFSSGEHDFFAIGFGNKCIILGDIPAAFACQGFSGLAELVHLSIARTRLVPPNTLRQVAEAIGATMKGLEREIFARGGGGEALLAGWSDKDLCAKGYRIASATGFAIEELAAGDHYAPDWPEYRIADLAPNTWIDAARVQHAMLEQMARDGGLSSNIVGGDLVATTVSEGTVSARHIWRFPGYVDLLSEMTHGEGALPEEKQANLSEDREIVGYAKRLTAIHEQFDRALEFHNSVTRRNRN